MGSLYADQGSVPKVLIADDERLIADTLQVILNKNGFAAATAYDGQAAIDTARVWQPDIFLSDVVMPGLNGIEAAIRICNMIPECHVVLFSGQAATTDLLHEAGLQGYRFEILHKPIAPVELLAHLWSTLRDGVPRRN
jgi:DNA-binding response OmpR family regulator